MKFVGLVVPAGLGYPVFAFPAAKRPGVVTPRRKRAIEAALSCPGIHHPDFLREEMLHFKDAPPPAFSWEDEDTRLILRWRNRKWEYRIVFVTLLEI